MQYVLRKQYGNYNYTFVHIYTNYKLKKKKIIIKWIIMSSSYVGVSYDFWMKVQQQQQHIHQTKYHENT